MSVTKDQATRVRQLRLRGWSIAGISRQTGVEADEVARICGEVAAHTAASVAAPGQAPMRRAPDACGHPKAQAGGSFR